MVQNGALRTETIGSFIRPPELSQAREVFNDGDLAKFKHFRDKPAALEALEDRCIREVVAMQEELGLDVVTDGEFRRSIYFEGFLNRIGGIEMKPDQSPGGFVTGYVPPRTHVVGKLRWPEGGATVGEFNYLKSIARAVPKVTLPSPLHSLFFIDEKRVDPKVYPDLGELWRDMEGIYAQELAALARAGCRYVQLDETTIVRMSDPKYMDFLRARGIEPEKQFATWMAVLDGVARRKPEGMTLGIHICRGNGPRGSWFSSGGYEPIADALFNHVDADRYLLEYETERAGDFAPLRHLKGNKVVVLGVVSTKVPALEKASLLKSRIDEAARFAPLENLAISPQCGFLSSMIGMPLTIDDEKKKLALMVEVARDVWH